MFNTQTAQWKRQGKIEGMTDEEIDEYLKKISESPLQIIVFKKQENIVNEGKEEFLKNFKEQFNYVYLCDELKLFKEISKENNDGIYAFDLTKKGRKVLRLGGWLKYIERKEGIEKKKELKEDYELKIVEFQAKNPRLPYYIALGSFILAMASFIKSCSTEERTLSYKQETKLYKKEQPILQNNNLVDSTKVSKKK